MKNRQIGAILWLVSASCCLAVFCIGAPVRAQDFVIECPGPPVQPLLTVTSQGNLIVGTAGEGGALVYGHEETLEPNPQVREFLVRWGTGQDARTLLRAAADDNRIYVRGQVHENESVIQANPQEPELLFESPQGYVGKLDLNGNLFLTGAVDPRYCIHHGLPNNNGWLEDDISLPNEGVGYYHQFGTDPPDTDDFCGENWMQEKIRLIGLQWNRTPRVGINDISLQGGGYWADHSSHQNGLDVDVRYVRSDGQEIAYDFGPLDPPPGYDPIGTQTLVNLFASYGAVVIFVDARAGLISPPDKPGLVVPSAGHSHHFHVRFVDPDGTGN